MTDESGTRFARHELIAGWDQAALARSTVVVAGVGALGNEVSRLLAMAGVGRIVLCDPDLVSQSNLSRTVLFREADIGTPKVHAAAAALHGLAPHTTVDARFTGLVSGVGLGELRTADLVVSCLDSRSARLSLMGRCAMVGQGMLDAGTSAWGGEVRYFAPGESCFGCGLSYEDRSIEDDPISCAGILPVPAVGASAPLSALIGAWQATVGVRLLCGLRVDARTIAYGAETGVRLIDRVRDRDCPLHTVMDLSIVRRVECTSDSTVDQLLSELGTPAPVLSWAQFTDAAGRRTRLLRAAGSDRSLRELGVAPAEILPVLRDAGRPAHYVELAAGPEGIQ